MPDIRYYAMDWLRRGYFPVPIPFREKGPKLEGWQNLHLTAGQIPNYFNGQPQNIGVLLGEPYGNCDIDLDSPETVAAFPLFAPDTGLIFGRRGKPRSHWFYRIDPPHRTAKYLDPVHGTALLEFRCLKADGSVGLQTVVPPSVHPSGEAVEFWRDGEAANVDAGDLGRAVRWTAAVALLKRHWPGEGGGRHDAFLALAGALAYARWELGDATALVGALYRLLWPNGADLSAAAREVESTFQRFDDGHEITGLPHLVKLVVPVAVKSVAKWLALRQEPERKEKLVFHVRSIPSVWSFETGEIEWVLETLVATGTVNLLTGDSGIGKSTFALALAGAIAHGKPFLGRPTKRCPVLYVDRENPLPITKERLLRLRIEETHDLIIWGTWNDPWPEGPVSPAILEFVKAERPMLLYDALIGFNKGDEQNATEMRRHMEGYRQLAALGATILILHNTGKSETAKWFRGSSDIKAAIDAAYLLESTGNGTPGTGLGNYRLVPFKTRLAPPNPIYLSYASGRFESTDAPQALADLDRFQQELRLNPRITGGRLIQLLAPHLSEHRVKSLLLEGLKKGWIDQIKGKGRGGNQYWLRDQDPEEEM